MSFSVFFLPALLIPLLQKVGALISRYSFNLNSISLASDPTCWVIRDQIYHIWLDFDICYNKRNFVNPITHFIRLFNIKNIQLYFYLFKVSRASQIIFATFVNVESFTGHVLSRTVQIITNKQFGSLFYF